MTRVAVIDDDPTVLLILQRALAASAVSIQSADTAADGWELIQRQRPDVVVLDVQLPDMSGLALFQRVQGWDATLPVVFITSSGASATVIEAMQMGAFDYLQKPLNLPVVRDVIERARAAGRLRATPVRLGDADAAADTDVMVGRSSVMQEGYK